jgi:DNA-directed RNA polymerase specialized sigma24 family protein
VNRADRVRKVIPGAPDELVDALAGRPAGEVDLIIAGLRQARRDALAADKAKRRQAREDRRKYHHIEDDQQAGATERMLSATGQRAARSLDALADLVRFERATIPALKRMAVSDLRAQGYSDPEIARALGVTSQRVGQLYGLKENFHPATPESEAS